MHLQSDSPLQPMVHKLSLSFPLEQREQQALLDLPYTVQKLPRRQVVFHEGAFSADIRILLSGLACSYRPSGQGRRIVTALHDGGDILNMKAAFAAKADGGAWMLTPGSVANVPSRILVALALEAPRLAVALWRRSTEGEAAAQDWASTIGRDGRARVVRLLLELALRVEATGAASRHRFDLPMTADEIAEAIALCPTHVSRIFHNLAELGLVRRDGHQIEIIDWEQLVEVSELPGYRSSGRTSFNAGPVSGRRSSHAGD
jgi:CRP-like cAMP-binding protein